jgi:hypothetical protein
MKIINIGAMRREMASFFSSANPLAGTNINIMDPILFTQEMKEKFILGNAIM